MRHQPDHDPLLDYRTCLACHAALSAAFVTLADLDLAPKDTDTLIEKLREIAGSNIQEPA